MFYACHVHESTENTVEYTVWSITHIYLIPKQLGKGLRIKKWFSYMCATRNGSPTCVPLKLLQDR